MDFAGEPGIDMSRAPLYAPTPHLSVLNGEMICTDEMPSVVVPQVGRRKAQGLMWLPCAEEIHVIVTTMRGLALFLDCSRE